MSPGDRRDMIKPDHPKLSLSAQCRVLNISRSTLYYRPLPASEETLALMKSIDKLFTKYPFFGSRQIAVSLARDGIRAGRHRVRRLMRLMGLEAVYKRPKTSQPHPAHPVFPYLLKGMEITRPNQVWCSDITFIPVSRGYLYLVAIMDWATRKVLSWRVSNTMHADFCVDALKEAIGNHEHRSGQPAHRIRLDHHTNRCARARQYGWTWALPGQYLYRTAVAVPQI